eukprot:4340107-Amphidinium_carterae.1
MKATKLFRKETYAWAKSSNASGDTFFGGLSWCKQVASEEEEVWRATAEMNKRSKQLEAEAATAKGQPGPWCGLELDSCAYVG